MIIVGDIGNTETKICLVNSKNIIIKRVTLSTKKISHSLLNKSLFGSANLRPSKSWILIFSKSSILTFPSAILDNPGNIRTINE